MSRPLKPHVIVERWTTGGFHVERFARCRCGWVGWHYNAGVLREQFEVHKQEASESPTGVQP
jgi:hypothetical protein